MAGWKCKAVEVPDVDSRLPLGKPTEAEEMATTAWSGEVRGSPEGGLGSKSREMVVRRMGGLIVKAVFSPGMRWAEAESEAREGRNRRRSSCPGSRQAMPLSAGKNS